MLFIQKGVRSAELIQGLVETGHCLASPPVRHDNLVRQLVVLVVCFRRHGEARTGKLVPVLAVSSACYFPASPLPSSRGGPPVQPCTLGVPCASCLPVPLALVPCASCLPVPLALPRVPFLSEHVLSLASLELSPTIFKTFSHEGNVKRGSDLHVRDLYRRPGTSSLVPLRTCLTRCFKKKHGPIDSSAQ